MPSNDLLWPTFRGPADLAEIERVPLEERGLPASTYELVTRAACLWPDRPDVCWRTPSTSTHRSR
jgi:fatty-acyl-CoA synthase